MLRGQDIQSDLILQPEESPPDDQLRSTSLGRTGLVQNQSQEVLVCFPKQVNISRPGADGLLLNKNVTA